MAEEPTTAELLQDKLTEYGLVRVLARQDVAPQLVKAMPLEDAARANPTNPRTVTGKDI